MFSITLQTVTITNVVSAKTRVVPIIKRVNSHLIDKKKHPNEITIPVTINVVLL